MSCRSQAGTKATLYQPTTRAYLAFFRSQVDPDVIVRQASEETLNTELAALALFMEEKSLKERSMKQSNQDETS